MSVAFSKRGKSADLGVWHVYHAFVAASTADVGQANTSVARCTLYYRASGF